jgi:2-polyprenyl-6-methoxyphenol hydroxylase-like FAD-dependent oxidoreductase
MAEIAIVGGGPSGAMCGEQLARAGHTVDIFDEHLAWEKPCGGGLTQKAIDCFPFLLDNPHPKKLVRALELISSNEQRVTLDMSHPIVIYSRKVLNGMLLNGIAQATLFCGRRVADRRFRGAGRWRAESVAAGDAPARAR